MSVLLLFFLLFFLIGSLFSFFPFRTTTTAGRSHPIGVLSHLHVVAHIAPNDSLRMHTFTWSANLFHAGYL